MFFFQYGWEPVLIVIGFVAILEIRYSTGDLMVFLSRQTEKMLFINTEFFKLPTQKRQKGQTDRCTNSIHYWVEL